MTEREWKKLKAELPKMSRERFLEWLKGLPATPENFGVLRAVLAEVFDAWVDEEEKLASATWELRWEPSIRMYLRKKPRI
jgi:hypothetical protein